MEKKIKIILAIVTIAIVVGATVLFLFQEQNNAGYDAYEPTDIKNVVITLERTPAWTSPVYTLTIYGNGTVVYEGTVNVNITGTRTINISEGEVRQLISEFEKIDYFSLNVNSSQGFEDKPMAITSFTINRETKTIEHWDNTEPIELTELEDKIDEIVNSSQWID